MFYLLLCMAVKLDVLLKEKRRFSVFENIIQENSKEQRGVRKLYK